MAIRNKTTVYINGINLTSFTVMPIKWGNLLDEQLDECYLSLRHCPIKNFKPLTPVETHFSNELYFAETSWNTQNRLKDMSWRMTRGRPKALLGLIVGIMICISSKLPKF